MSAAAAVPPPGPGGGVRQLRWAAGPGRAGDGPGPPALLGICPTSR